jgi:hypothetical protein
MPNLTEQGLREYVETFHATLSETASSCLPESDRSRILHISLLPATITGYVSTQFGVAVEYELATTTSINVVRGSARVEDLLVQAPHVLQNTGPLIAIPGSNIVIHGLHLKGAFPFRLTSENAAVTLRDMLFSAGP